MYCHPHLMAAYHLPNPASQRMRRWSPMAISTVIVQARGGTVARGFLD